MNLEDTLNFLLNESKQVDPEKPAKDLKALAAKIAGIKTQIAELKQQLDEIDYVEYGAYDVGAVVKIKDKEVGWIKEIEFRNWPKPGFVYKVGSFKKDGTPNQVGVIAYFAKHENLEVMEDDKN